MMACKTLPPGPDIADLWPATCWLDGDDRFGVNRAVCDVIDELVRDEAQIGMTVSCWWRGEEVVRCGGGCYRSLTRDAWAMPAAQKLRRCAAGLTLLSRLRRCCCKKKKLRRRSR